MAEYIERETLKNQIAGNKLMAREPAAKQILAMIDDMPAADVAPVVRCKDCKFRKTEDCAMYCECECGYQFSWETDNDFCSYGRRKEQNNG